MGGGPKERGSKAPSSLAAAWFRQRGRLRRLAAQSNGAGRRNWRYWVSPARRCKLEKGSSARMRAQDKVAAEIGCCRIISCQGSSPGWAETALAGSVEAAAKEPPE
ncbi:hypothetical protein J2S34_003648 [Nitrobacter winogradskyi]|uniref:Uncharacterized protein n=2 Tax=Nitrobacter winogradskyi TaxID=913 RepID=A0ACC6APT9_NITWI|nr:hypothetical protein [Nitrobacter winogradskyi]GEC17656.1 hypothetical protein NWI01_35480 [Nitrobacter winogradskyi]